MKTETQKSRERNWGDWGEGREERGRKETGVDGRDVMDGNGGRGGETCWRIGVVRDEHTYSSCSEIIYDAILITWSGVVLCDTMPVTMTSRYSDHRLRLERVNAEESSIAEHGVHCHGPNSTDECTSHHFR